MPSKQTIHVPFVKGVDTKAHPFALEMPDLAACENGLFSKPGSIQKRYGHSTFTAAVTPAITTLTSGKATNPGFDALTSSVSPTANSLVLLAVLVRDSAVVGSSLGIDAITGNGLTWVPVGSIVLVSGTPGCKLFLYRALGSSPSAGQIDITLTDSTYDTVIWSVVQCANVDTSGTNGSGAVRQSATGTGTAATSLALSMGAFSSAGSVTYGAFASIVADGATPEAGWTELHDEQQGSGTVATLETEWKASADTTPSASFPNATTVGGIAIEIAPPTPGIDIDGGGHLTNITGLAVRELVNGEEELICFAESSQDPDQPSVFSWSPALSKWVSRGNYDACEVSSRTVVQKPTEQTFGDRAQYGNVVLRAWFDSDTSTVKIQCLDATSGSPLSSETNLGGSSVRPRCLAVGGKLHVYYMDGTAVKGRVIDPAAPRTSVGSSSITIGTASTSGGPYDVCNRGSSESIIVYRTAATTYNIHRLPAAITGGSSASKTQNNTSGTPFGVAYESNLDRIAVIRHDSGSADLRGDILNGTSFADVTVDVLLDGLALADPGLDSGVEQIAVAFRETAESDGTYRCVVFYSGSSNDPPATTTSNVVKVLSFGTDGNVSELDGPSGGTGTTYWAIHSAVGTRAFAIGRYVYCGIIRTRNGDTTQSAYFIVRSDGVIVARAVPWNAGQKLTLSCLPQVESLGSSRFTFTSIYRTRVGSRAQNLYADRGLKDVTLDFASSAPFRGVQLGRSLYMPGGYFAMYDGRSVTESNFYVIPDILSLAASTTGDGALTVTSTYSYKVYLEWRNEQGEIERSSQVSAASKLLAGTENTITITLPTLAFTAKRTNGPEQRAAISYAIYRTQANGSVYYRVSSLDPTQTAAANNGYKLNSHGVDFVTFVDKMADAGAGGGGPLTSKEPDPFPTDGELDPIAPDPCSVIAQGQDRVFLAGFENPDVVFYSKLWQEDGTVEFNDALTILLPREGGRVTAIAANDADVIIWKESQIYGVAGAGSPNVLNGSGYSEPRLLSSDVGCSDARTLALTPMGWVFQSAKGFRLLSAGLQVQDIGAPVAAYASAEYVAALPLADQNLILFVAATGGTSLAYDYFMGTWSTWTKPAGVAAVLWNGGYVYATSSAVYKSDTAVYTDDGTAYNLAVETPWIKFGGLNGWGRCWELRLLGEYKASHKLRVRVAYDYVASWVDDRTWTPDTSRYQLRHGLRRPKCGAFKVRFEDTADVGTLGNSAALVGMSLKMGMKGGLSRQPGTRSQ